MEPAFTGLKRQAIESELSEKQECVIEEYEEKDHDRQTAEK